MSTCRDLPSKDQTKDKRNPRSLPAGTSEAARHFRPRPMLQNVNVFCSKHMQALEAVREHVFCGSLLMSAVQCCILCHPVLYDSVALLLSQHKRHDAAECKSSFVHVFQAGNRNHSHKHTHTHTHTTRHASSTRLYFDPHLNGTYPGCTLWLFPSIPPLSLFPGNPLMEATETVNETGLISKGVEI